VALGVVRDLRSPRSLADPAEAAAYQEHLMAEYVLARLAHGVADGTIRGEITAVEQFLEHAGVFVWEIEPAHADRFLGQHQRHQAPETRRGKAGAVDLFFRFLEARYRGEIHELTGRVVASPIGACNRPRHCGDFHVRVPPSPQALAAFFAGWRGELPAARKWLAAARHYAMARLADETGLRLAELCGLRLEDLHFGHGPLGKIHVRLGKGLARLGATGADGADAGGSPRGTCALTGSWPKPRPAAATRSGSLTCSGSATPPPCGTAPTPTGTVSAGHSQPSPPRSGRSGERMARPMPAAGPEGTRRCSTVGLWT
jgi:hypothetical protein